MNSDSGCFFFHFGVFFVPVGATFDKFGSSLRQTDHPWERMRTQGSPGESRGAEGSPGKPRGVPDRPPSDPQRNPGEPREAQGSPGEPSEAQGSPRSTRDGPDLDQFWSSGGGTTTNRRYDKKPAKRDTSKEQISGTAELFFQPCSSLSKEGALEKW